MQKLYSQNYNVVLAHFLYPSTNNKGWNNAITGPIPLEIIKPILKNIALLLKARLFC
jgi:hypothetical protein